MRKSASLVCIGGLVLFSAVASCGGEADVPVAGEPVGSSSQGITWYGWNNFYDTLGHVLKGPYTTPAFTNNGLDNGLGVSAFSGDPIDATALYEKRFTNGVHAGDQIVNPTPPCAFWTRTAARLFSGASTARTCVVGICSNFNSWYSCRSGTGAWDAWSNLYGQMIDESLSVRGVSGSNGTFMLYGVATGSRLWYTPVPGTWTLSPSQPPGDLVSVAAAGNGSTTVDVVVLNTLGAVYHSTHSVAHPPYTWSTWTRVGGVKPPAMRDKIRMFRYETAIHAFTTGTGANSSNIMSADKADGGAWGAWQVSPGALPIPSIEPAVNSVAFHLGGTMIAAEVRAPFVPEHGLQYFSNGTY